MRAATALPHVIATLLAAAQAGCGAATGSLYPETLARAGPLPEGQARIVFLRSDDLANKKVISPVYVRADKRPVGELAWGGFLIAQLPAGAAVLTVSARNPMFGVCELRVTVADGETLYVDVDPRRQYAAAEVAGAVAAGAVTVASPSTVGIGDLADTLVTEPAVAGAAGATAEAAASAVEGAGKRCAGPYRMAPIAEAAALAELARLKSSH